MKDALIAISVGILITTAVLGYLWAIQWLIFHNHDIAACALGAGPMALMISSIAFKWRQEEKEKRGAK